MKHSPQFLKLVSEAKARVRETNVADVKQRIESGEKFLLVDVREDNEWANGHLPGAVHLGKGIIERDIEQRVPDTGAKLILYCGGGLRSFHWRRKNCRRWDTPTWNRWVAAGGGGAGAGLPPAKGWDRG